MQFPALSKRAGEIASLPSLGLLTLAGMTRERFGRRFMEIDDPATCDLPLDCDGIAITALAATEREVIRLAHRCREAGIFTIVGGLHATLQPERFRDCADAVVIGEGEVVWPRILEDLEAGRLQSVYDSRPFGSFDLRDSPMPAFELLGSAEGRRFTVQSQRGCPWQCDFCAASMRLAPHQSKPVERVMAEVHRLADLYAADFVELADDNTFANRRHAKALLEALAKTDVRFFAETDLSLADDPDLLARLRDAGCREVLIGFESPDFDPLDGVEERANWKAKRVDGALRAVERIQSQGIAVCGSFVLGLDGAGPESFYQVEHFTGGDALASAKWNMGLLALVSLWRVAIIVRVVFVLTGSHWWTSLVVVLFPASVEAFLASWFGQFDVVGMMGGIELSPTARFRLDALSLISTLSFLIAFLTLVLVLVPVQGKRPGKAGFRLEKEPLPRGALVTAAVCLVAWIAYAVPFQRDPGLREPRRSIERGSRERVETTSLGKIPRVRHGGGGPASPHSR